LIELLAQLILPNNKPSPTVYEGRVPYATVQLVEPVVLSYKPIESLPYIVVDYTNLYAFGNCTYYVKNRRPDLPNDLGNANTWYIRAIQYGLATGTEPRVGAVGTTTAGSLGHVVYIEAVDGNTITVSEMNSVGFNIISSREALASDFLYIY
jgi:surface antigen